MFDPLPPGPHLVMVHSTNSMQPPLLCLLLGYPLPLPVSDVLYVRPLVQAASINACGSATPLKDKLTAVGRGRRQSGRLIMHKRGVCQEHSFFLSVSLFGCHMASRPSDSIRDHRIFPREGGKCRGSRMKSRLFSCKKMPRQHRPLSYLSLGGM